MESRILSLSILLLLLLSLSTSSFLSTGGAVKVFNVRSRYHALPDNSTDNTLAVKKAWRDACRHNGNARVVIPRGWYYLRSVILKGPCNDGTKEFVIRGTLRAPTRPARLFFTDHWITFRHVNKLKIYGGGTLDGQGAYAWPHNNCKTGSCKPLPVSLRLDFVNDSSVTNLTSLNSKNFHINLFSCFGVTLRNLTITAPEDSPNTDGIHLGSSGHVTIDSTDISTGDDCISISTGSHDVLITNVSCGPGHGISVGSMGRSTDERERVRSVRVVNCTFRGTTNGVQIKTWPESEAIGGFASDFVYENILMRDVRNPIFINQEYCPYNLCNPQGSSKIKISNITFRNIWGTCTTKDAVKLQCSKSNPCQDIALENINLVGPGGLTSSSCSNVYGSSRGRVKPASCLN